MKSGPFFMSVRLWWAKRPEFLWAQMETVTLSLERAPWLWITSCFCRHRRNRLRMSLSTFAFKMQVCKVLSAVPPWRVPPFPSTFRAYRTYTFCRNCTPCHAWKVSFWIRAMRFPLRFLGRKKWTRCVPQEAGAEPR